MTPSFFERTVTVAKFRIVGVVIQKVPFAEPGDLDNSGYGVAAPIDAVIDMVEFAGAGPSATLRLNDSNRKH